MRRFVYSRGQIPQRVLEEDKVPEVWESLVGIRKHSSSWDKVTSQQSSRSLWRRWQSSSCQKGDPGSTEVVGRAGGAEQLGKLNTLRGFFSFLLCSDEKQSPNAKFFLKVTSCAWLLAEQGWGKHSLCAVGCYCHWEFLVSHILHLKLCCQRILLKLWVFFTRVSFFFLPFEEEEHLRGVLRCKELRILGCAVIRGKLSGTGGFCLIFFNIMCSCECESRIRLSLAPWGFISVWMLLASRCFVLAVFSKGHSYIITVLVAYRWKLGRERTLERHKKLLPCGFRWS